MLTLSRKEGESIVIDKETVITITKLRGGRVTISISAPAAVRIRRGELEEREAA